MPKRYPAVAVAVAVAVAGAEAEAEAKAKAKAKAKRSSPRAAHADSYAADDASAGFDKTPAALRPILADFTIRSGRIAARHAC
jgi:hypothetical protein